MLYHSMYYHAGFRTRSAMFLALQRGATRRFARKRRDIPRHSTQEALQAEIDRLMLEFCPDEMSEEQLAEWARHQRAVPLNTKE
jgi:hypothetical protein